MPMIRRQCRLHPGGIFGMPARKGRPPVKCTEEYPCDKVDAAPPAAHDRHFVPSESGAEPPVGPNDSLPLAMAAKARLEAVGWTVKGRAWIAPMTTWHMAEITCSRGAETLMIVWQDGVLNDQDYQMESIRPAENGIPPHSLPFNPEEVTDSELARLISGMKVTWWNSLAGSRETAIVSPKVNIEHIFVGGGDTDNSKRIVKFIDHSGGGFRAFHAGALLKVG